MIVLIQSSLTGLNVCHFIYEYYAVMVFKTGAFSALNFFGLAIATFLITNAEIEKFKRKVISY